jgi:hypothetical protein
VSLQDVAQHFGLDATCVRGSAAERGWAALSSSLDELLWELRHLITVEQRSVQLASDNYPQRRCHCKAIAIELLRPCTTLTPSTRR